MFLYLAQKSPVYSVLCKRAKRLASGVSETGGRNNQGCTTLYKRGNRQFRRLYKFVDFWRRLKISAFVVKIEKDAFRSATVSLVFYQSGFLSYLILPEGYSVGSKLMLFHGMEEGGDLSVARLYNGNTVLWGQAVPLSVVPNGTLVFNLELFPGKGGQICRAAGTSAVVLSNFNGFTTVKLRSGWKMLLSASCMATVGVSSNGRHMYKKLNKAGLVRNLGYRPTVRGVAMNAVDHPHGGGRGKTSGGPQSRTPWGKITKQRKTVLAQRRLNLVRTRFR